MVKAWKVYGAEGHRQRESFCDSREFTTWNGNTVQVMNADKTGTNEYSVFRVTAETADECERCLWAQISDGVFENCRVGCVEEIPEVIA